MKYKHVLDNPKVKSEPLRLHPPVRSLRSCIMPPRGNRFLDGRFSDESDPAEGYDSEAAEFSKGGRSTSRIATAKKRKLSYSSSGGEDGQEGMRRPRGAARFDTADLDGVEDDNENSTELQKMASGKVADYSDDDFIVKSAVSKISIEVPRKQPKGKDKPKPGVIYLSSLPPYLRPSALRNLLTQRGFGPITRLFLTPASKASSTSKKNSRQLYTEGWIEFASKKMARACAETLNASPVGGKKGGFYRDDLWNMKYLKKMAWDELMAGVREEKREEEGKRDEERRIIAGEAKRFVEGVERSKQEEGMKTKRKKGKDEDGGTRAGLDEVKRTWRQFEVMGVDRSHKRLSMPQQKDVIEHDVRAVLGKIF